MRHGWTYWTGIVLAFLVIFRAEAAPEGPALPAGDLLLKKTAIELFYNPTYKQADAVFYPLDSDQLRACVKRTDQFRADKNLPEGAGAELSDFAGSGYDRGHLSPAGDNRFSLQAMQDSFLLSNVSPQEPHFNSGIWARLENLVRAWAAQSKGIFVTTGPVLREGLPSIGGNHISIPEAFYKVLVTKDHTKAVAFLMPQNAAGPLESYMVSVDDVEKATGLNFLSGLEQKEQASLESTVKPENWNFDERFKYEPCQKTSF